MTAPSFPLRAGLVHALLLAPGVVAAQTAAQPAALPGPASSLPAPPGTNAGKPWRVQDALGRLWLRIGLEHRSRFEHLGNDFRTANPGDATGLSARTLLLVEARIFPLFVGFEVKDSRAWVSSATPINATIVDPLDLLQGYAGLRGKDIFFRGDEVSLTMGRMTIDLGGRRLVARNDFRNTINAFTGVDVRWLSPARDIFRVFAVSPVVRLPSEPEELRENRARLDRENTDTLLWAAFFQSRPLAAQVTIEAYVVGLREHDSGLAPSAERRLSTPGFRALRPVTSGEFDFQFEVMGQFGRSRASIAEKDTTDLAHLAYALHASGGFRFRVPLAPRVILQYDYATGDRSPKDGRNNRFDTLFGARRFEFGPTGLYGAVARSNLLSPGVRVEVEPLRATDAFAAYRLVWLASPQDAWTASGLRDPSGASGRFVGQQVEARVRWYIFPRNLSADIGGALLVRGDFARKAPEGEDAPSTFVYSQITGTI